MASRTPLPSRCVLAKGLHHVPCHRCVISTLKEQPVTTVGAKGSGIRPQKSTYSHLQAGLISTAMVAALGAEWSPVEREETGTLPFWGADYKGGPEGLQGRAYKAGCAMQWSAAGGIRASCPALGTQNAIDTAHNWVG